MALHSHRAPSLGHRPSASPFRPEPESPQRSTRHPPSPRSPSHAPRPAGRGVDRWEGDAPPFVLRTSESTPHPTLLSANVFVVLNMDLPRLCGALHSRGNSSARSVPPSGHSVSVVAHSRSICACIFARDRGSVFPDKQFDSIRWFAGPESAMAIIGGLCASSASLASQGRGPRPSALGLPSRRGLPRRSSQPPATSTTRWLG